jgi:hypothetical protein
LDHHRDRLIIDITGCIRKADAAAMRGELSSITLVDGSTSTDSVTSKRISRFLSIVNYFQKLKTNRKEENSIVQKESGSRQKSGKQNTSANRKMNEMR